ncbi:MAG: hypothetical protein JWM64_2201 [Frankiales bacterium]|nr:hypothetical protein [Frankiales bacterium]
MTKADLRELAREMYLGGARYRGIQEELGVSRSTLSVWLRDLKEAEPRVLPAAEAGDGRVAEARALRAEGLFLREIAGLLGASAPQVHRWVRDLPVPARARPGGDPEHMRAMRDSYWAQANASREHERQHVQASGAAEVGQLSDRELLLLGVCAYWCEGGKSKPWNRRETLTFINSDEGLVRLFDRWLDLAGNPREERHYRVAIHETADVEAASAYWADVVGVRVDELRRPTLKRHNPATVRKNTGERYVGCLVVQALQSRLMYQRLTGLWTGIVEALPPARSA